MLYGFENEFALVTSAERLIRGGTLAGSAASPKPAE
jgi:hypothetical protein